MSRTAFLRTSLRRVAWFLPLLWAVAAPAALALRSPDAFADLGEDDRRALERLASEPESRRLLALEAGRFPDTLVEMQLLQARSSAAFQQRIAPLSREDQEAIWEIAREPGLLRELARGGPKSAEGLERIARTRPEPLREQISSVGARHAELLVELQGIADDADQRFEALLVDLPEDARDAYRELVDCPELLTLLATHVRLTVELGDAYSVDPEGTLQRLAALSDEVARRDAEANADWQESLSQDPDAVADLEDAARTYAEEQGLSYDDLTSTKVEATVHVTVHPYPYWFGYPSWYVFYDAYPWGYWYPLPIQFGFYYRPHHLGLVWFGLPSFRFVYWYGHVWPGYRGHRPHHRYHGRFYAYVERYPPARYWRHEGQRHAKSARQTWSSGRPRKEARSAAQRRGFFERSLRSQSRSPVLRGRAVEGSSRRAAEQPRARGPARRGDDAAGAPRSVRRRPKDAGVPVGPVDSRRGRAAPRAEREARRSDPTGRSARGAAAPAHADRSPPPQRVRGHPRRGGERPSARPARAAVPRLDARSSASGGRQHRGGRR